jgi:hypothetical protein
VLLPHREAKIGDGERPSNRGSTSRYQPRRPVQEARSAWISTPRGNYRRLLSEISNLESESEIRNPRSGGLGVHEECGRLQRGSFRNSIEVGPRRLPTVKQMIKGEQFNYSPRNPVNLH